MKDHFKRLGLAVPTLLLAFTTVTVIPALALSSSGNNAANDVTTVSASNGNQKVAAAVTSTSTTSTNDTATGNQTEVTSSTTVASDNAQTTALHLKGQALVAELQKGQKTKLTDTQRQKVCEVHKQGLANKFTVISSNGVSYQARIDDVYTKALAFQTTNNVTSNDLTTLIATADAAKATSATSVANLQAVKTTIDCNSVSVASDVATFKTAAGQARTDLNSYKAAVKAVIQALKTATKTTAATPTTTTSTTGKSN